MLRRHVLLIVVVIFCSQSVQGESYPRHIYSGLKGGFDNRFILPAAGGIWLAHFLDGPVHDHLTGRILPGPLVAPADIYGQGSNWLISSGYIFWHGSQNDLRQKDILKQFQYHSEAYLLNAVFTFAIKDLTGRLRPDGSNRQSFPSGHTSSSFVVAAMMQNLYGDTIGIPAYVMATITGLQRIHGEKHWLSDVLAGALLGTVIGNGFGKLLSEPVKKSSHILTVSFSF